MIYLFVSSATRLAAYIAAILAFALTFAGLKIFKDILPADIGRAYAVNAAAAKGKPRGAGILFVIVFLVLTLVFVPLKWEAVCYCILLFLAMLAGFLDDASKAPWSDYKKGLIDLVISFFVTLVFVLNNSTDILMVYSGKTLELPVWLYLILGTVLVWMSVNVVNCTDGVDGLSSTLTLISMSGFIVLLSKAPVLKHMYGQMNPDSTPILMWIYIFMGCIAAYLLFNAGPSILLMGDAGSRTIGVFFALTAMKSGCPQMFIPLCLVFIIDGGLGLVKVFLLRFFKIHILKNVRTPIHDHVRKNKGWSDAQTVIRFAVSDLLVIFLACYMIKNF